MSAALQQPKYVEWKAIQLSMAACPSIKHRTNSIIMLQSYHDHKNKTNKWVKVELDAIGTITWEGLVECNSLLLQTQHPDPPDTASDFTLPKTVMLTNGAQRSPFLSGNVSMLVHADLQ